MPITIRPFETSCMVAYQLAVIVGSRMPGFVTQWPSFRVFVCAAASGSSAIGLLPEDVRVVRPAVLEPVLLGSLEELDQAPVRRVRHDGDAETQQGPEHTPGQSRDEYDR